MIINPVRYTKTNKINKQIFSIPYQNDVVTYNGSLQSPSWSNYDSLVMTISGDTNAVNAGIYTVTFSLIDKENTLWNDYTSTDKTVTWEIQEATIYSIPSQGGTLSYSGITVSPVWNNYNSSQMTISGTTSAINAGTYVATFTPNPNYKWNDGTNTAKNVIWKIDRAKINVPTQNGTLTYNGQSQEPVWNNYDPTKMTMSGTTSAIEAGNHSTQFTPLENYEWSDGTISTKTVTWSIQARQLPQWKIRASLPGDTYYGSIAFGNDNFVVLNENSASGEAILSYSSNISNWSLCNTSYYSGGNSGMYGRCIAYGDNGFSCLNLNNNQALYSSDGVTFSNGTIDNAASGYSGAEFKSMAYGNGVYISVGSTKNQTSLMPVFAKSTNSKNWFITNLTPYNDFIGDWSDIAYGSVDRGNLFIATDNDSNKLLIISNEQNYSIDGLPNSNCTNSRIAYGDGKFVVVCLANGNLTAFYTENGVVWQTGEISFSGYFVPSAISYGNNMFICIDSSDKYLYSYNGISWNESSFGYSGYSYGENDIAFGNNKFVTVGFDGVFYTQ